MELEGGADGTQHLIDLRHQMATMSTADDLSLPDWTARQSQPGKSRSTPQHLAPLFDRLGVNAEIWCCSGFGAAKKVQIAEDLRDLDRHEHGHDDPQE